MKPAASEILADGTIKSQDEVTLHFQTGGKLVYLPLLEGNDIFQGQTIAQLDTYALQRQLSTALNTFRSTRDTFDQTKDNSQTGVLQGAQKYTLDTQNKSGIGGQTETDVINDIAKRIIDQNQANLDNSVINVELANYAMQLATLTSPINGTVIHEDVTAPFINITPVTSFTVANLNDLIFRTDISENDIDFISLGAQAKIQINSLKEKALTGTVIKIYPEKITLGDGRHVYKVDIQSNDLTTYGKYDQAGSVLIKSNASQNIILVPRWVVLANQSIWVLDGSRPILKNIETGKIHGSDIEIISGLSSNDKVITNPEYLVNSKYQLK